MSANEGSINISDHLEIISNSDDSSSSDENYDDDFDEGLWFHFLACYYSFSYYCLKGFIVWLLDTARCHISIAVSNLYEYSQIF